MKKNIGWLLSVIAGAGVLLCSSATRAETYTAIINGNWNNTNVWSPNGIPGAVDTAIIPAGVAVTNSGNPATVGIIQISGALTSSGTLTVGDVFIDVTGLFYVSASGGNVTFSGNVTNYGAMPITSQLGSAANYTYSGTDKTLAGNISNVVATINGTYNNIGTFVVGLKGNQNALKGTGALTNSGTLFLANGHNTTTTITTLDCSPVGNLVRWSDFNGTPTPKATAYYDLFVGHNGSGAWQFGGAGLSIARDLTITNQGPISSWPQDNTIPGKFTYLASSSTASTFPATFSVGAFNQSNGRLTIPANATLTVTGTGPGTWSKTGGLLITTAGSIVKFTGTAPDIGGTGNNSFANLTIDSTATNAAASSPLTVTNALTLTAGAALDVTANGTYTLTVTQSVISSGTIKGSLDTAANSRAKIFGGADGGFGTSTITGDLTLGSSNTVNLDVDVSAVAVNDHLAVGGTLTLNNTIFKLKAPGDGAPIDTANDYTLVTAANITGTPVLNWITAPADSGNYTLVTTATTIKLHYGGVITPGLPIIQPSVSGSDLTLSWDMATFPGYSLQAQTNASGISNNWSDLTSPDASPFNTQIDQANPSVFYRLYKP